ncbi:MAG TPA: NlpC/P60 family protein, partial [Ignavibacteriaceae bacterium]|nr:NlpC/P60 family protein [Ignavibacteriaceae bacterium]
MPKFFINIFYIICLITVFIYFGCSSSSYSSRYNTDKSEKKEKSNQRFSDNNDLAEITDSLNEDMDEIPDDRGIDITDVLKKIKPNENETDLDAENITLKEKLLMEIIKYLNTPYKYGGNSSDGIDCSAFTRTVYSDVLSIDLNRSAKDQYSQGLKIDNQEDLKFGDLVFFNTRRRVKPGHVGIYIGDNLFAHASSKYGVIVSSFDQDYYSHRF